MKRELYFRIIKKFKGLNYTIVFMGENAGWFCNINGKDYGEYINLPDDSEKNKDYDKKFIVNLLETQAREVIFKITKS